MRKRLLFVVNPVAGGLEKKPLLEAIRIFAAKNQLAYDLHYTTGENDQALLAEKLNAYGSAPAIVVAVGGDGTCNLVAKTIKNTAHSMALLPAGSANGLATELGIPHDWREALNLLLKSEPFLMDTLLINQTHTAIRMGDIGINARIVKRFSKSKNRGMRSYIKYFFETVWRSRPRRVMIWTNNRDFFYRNAHMVAFANATKYGTGAVLNPAGKLDDGKFEICLIKNISFRKLLAMFWEFFFGDLRESGNVEIIPCQDALILFKKPQMLQIDGEIIGRFQKIEVKIIPHSLQVLRPLPEPENPPKRFKILPHVDPLP